MTFSVEAAAKRPKVLPAQCAQSVRRVGRILSDQSAATIATARQLLTVKKESAPIIDTGKVISLHLVTSVSDIMYSTTSGVGT